MKQLYLLFFLIPPLQIFSQVAIINEFSSDPTMFDGSGGEFIELYCPSGGGDCDISCWILSDGQGLITIPAGTIIAEGGFYLISHAPAFNCDSCDFFGINVDLNTATCGCLSGGSYATGPDGNPSLVIGRFGNIGELMLLYNASGTLLESWSFNNAAAAYLPGGGLINSVAAVGCPGTSVDIPAADSNIITDVGSITIGCNSSYTRSTDGSSSWIIDNHPTPGNTNANMGNDAFEYYYSIDNGPWIYIPKTGNRNIDNHTDTLCTGDSIAFKVQIENHQNAMLSVFDSSGRYGSYFKSNLGIVQWPIVAGIGNVLGDTLILQSNNSAIEEGNNYFTLQWSDYKNGQGSFSSFSNNECYERLNATFVRHLMLDSAVVSCTDPNSGLSQVIAYPIGIDGIGTDIIYVLYDDIGNLSNPIDSNESGLFQLSSAASVDYYVQVRGLCNNVIAIEDNPFCTAIAPCPQITQSSYLINNNPCGSTGGGIVFTEDFENGSTAYTSSIAECTDLGGDYFQITDGSDVGGSYVGASGNFFAAQDIDAAGCPAGASSGETLTWSGININGLNSLVISIDAAEDDASDLGEDWDLSNFVHIDIQIDGGGYVPLIWFNGTNTNTEPQLDTDFDGIGDGTSLTDVFQTFSNSIAGTGSLLDIQITINLDAGDEDIALDNLILTAAGAPDTCDACPLDSIQFSVAGINLPYGGSIDWYYNYETSFSPYNGEGTFIGSSDVPVPDFCSSSTLVFNEFVARPAVNNGQDPNAGEMIELLGPPGMDLSCFVLTDGDWTITFPPGSIIPPDGIFTIGNDGVYGPGTFDLDAETCGCFTDIGGGGGLLILTDGGEYMALFDGSGNFVQGVMYGSPTAGNLPPNGASSIGGVINTVGLPGCQSSVTIPDASFFEVLGSSGSGVHYIRDPDGNGSWTTQAGGSINNCNFTASIPPVDDFSYEIPLDACDTILYFIGIINPHPNTVACPNTDPSAFTQEFMVRIICPEANLLSDVSICESDLPLLLPVSTNDIADGTSSTFNYTINGTSTSYTGTVVNDTLFLPVNNTGTYQALDIIPNVGCAGPAVNSIDVTVVPIPPAPSLPSPVTVCIGDTALLSASGASNFQWSLDNTFNTIAGTGTDFMIEAPDSVYVMAMNQDDNASVSCLGGVTGVEILTEPCDVILLNSDLIYFNALKKEQTVELAWQLETQLVHGIFELERSIDGIHFELLEKIPFDLALNSSVEATYMDQQPFSGWNYYRLKYPVDYDDQQYSMIRSIDFKSDLSMIQVFPNPTDDIIHLIWDRNIEEGVVIKLFDPLGKMILSQKLNQSKTQIDLKDLPAAVYILNIETTQGTRRYKIIKQ